MLDSENSPDNNKTLIISIGAVINNPKMIKFVPDHLKAKKRCVKMHLKSCRL